MGSWADLQAQSFHGSPFHQVQFSHSVVSDSLQPHGLQHARLPCPSTTPRTCSNPCPSSWWCHPAISSSVFPFSSCLQSFPAFPMIQFLTLGGQSIRASVQYQSFQWIIRTDFLYDWFDLLAVQGTLKRLLQHHNLIASFHWSPLLNLFSPTQNWVPRAASKAAWPWETPKFFSMFFWAWISKYPTNFSISLPSCFEALQRSKENFCWASPRPFPNQKGLSPARNHQLAPGTKPSNQVQNFCYPNPPDMGTKKNFFSKVEWIQFHILI